MISEHEEDVYKNLPDIPIVLDQAKYKIKVNVAMIKEPAYQLNLFSQLIGGQFEKDASHASEAVYLEQRERAKQQYEEEQRAPDAVPKVDLTDDGWVYDYTRAIILSYISNEAQMKGFYARNAGDK